MAVLLVLAFIGAVTAFAGVCWIIAALIIWADEQAE